MAPEAVEGEISIESDVYAFARVSVELLTGVLPTNARALETLLASFPPRTRAVLERALDARLESRPKDVRAVAEVLDPPAAAVALRSLWPSNWRSWTAVVATLFSSFFLAPVFLALWLVPSLRSWRDRIFPSGW